MAIDFMDIAVQQEQKAYRELCDVSLRYISDEDIIMSVCDNQEFMYTSAERELSRSRSRNHILGDVLA
jgi:hypothetical protein